MLDRQCCLEEHNIIVCLQADTACPRQESPIENGLWAQEDPETELIASDFYRYLNPPRTRPTILLGLVSNVERWWVTR